MVWGVGKGVKGGILGKLTGINMDIQDGQGFWGLLTHYPFILNLLKDVIPSVAEESEVPALDSISRFLDSSATLGMT